MSDTVAQPGTMTLAEAVASLGTTREEVLAATAPYREEAFTKMQKPDADEITDCLFATTLSALVGSPVHCGMLSTWTPEIPDSEDVWMPEVVRDITLEFLDEARPNG